MASYPTSIFAPTTKNAGDTIQPAHINDAQAEITAIETALITGPITLPNSTLASLSVTAGSTLTTLNVTGGSTLASLSVTGASTIATLTVTSAFTAPAVPYVKLNNSAAAAIPNAVTYTGLSWDTEVSDAAGLHSTSVNSSRINLTSSGLWHIGVQVEWTGNGTASQFVRIRLNDDVGLAGVNDAIENIDPHAQAVTAVHRATSTTDYVTAQVASKDSTGTVNPSSTNVGGTLFWAYRVSN